MKAFAAFFHRLDLTNKTGVKVAEIIRYFSEAPDEDKIWVLALFTGRRPPRKISSTQIKQWAIEYADIPVWLFDECYHTVGDLGETIALLLPEGSGNNEKSLAAWFAEFETLKNEAEEGKKEYIRNAWASLSRFELFVFNKLLMGSFRIGVSQALLTKALAELYQTETATLTHRLSGNWNPFETSFDALIRGNHQEDEPSKPYPFFLAYPIEHKPEDNYPPENWFIEWKWDGIRAQLIVRQGGIFIWSRGEELITEKFPELHPLNNLLPDGTVLDGEILAFSEHEPLPFQVLQTRITKKKVTKKDLLSAPAAFMAYDVLEFNGNDVRSSAHKERRVILEDIHASLGHFKPFRTSPLLPVSDWDQAKEMHQQSRLMKAEGFMIKRKAAAYGTGRKKGDWWKWKSDPYSVDAVLIYAQKGHGRRADLYTDYTFAVWNGNQLVSFAKAYSGLTDAEIKVTDRFIRQNTLEKFGPVRTVKPELVFEIGFEGINESPRHKSGIAVRFPRILRLRTDKKPEEADSLEQLRSILYSHHNPQST
jgi:DNA ligase-1